MSSSPLHYPTSFQAAKLCLYSKASNMLKNLQYNGSANLFYLFPSMHLDIVFDALCVVQIPELFEAIVSYYMQLKKLSCNVLNCYHLLKTQMTFFPLCSKCTVELYEENCSSFERVKERELTGTMHSDVHSERQAISTIFRGKRNDTMS